MRRWLLCAVISVNVAWAFEPKELFDRLPDRFFYEHAKSSEIVSFPYTAFLIANRPDRSIHAQSYYVMTSSEVVSKLSGNTIWCYYYT